MATHGDAVAAHSSTRNTGINLVACRLATPLQLSGPKNASGTLWFTWGVAQTGNSVLSPTSATAKPQARGHAGTYRSFLDRGPLLSRHGTLEGIPAPGQGNSNLPRPDLTSRRQQQAAHWLQARNALACLSRYRGQLPSCSPIQEVGFELSPDGSPRLSFLGPGIAPATADHGILQQTATNARNVLHVALARTRPSIKQIAKVSGVWTRYFQDNAYSASAGIRHPLRACVTVA